MVKRTTDWDADEMASVCATYVSSVVDNVDEFLRGRRSMTIDIDQAADRFTSFAEAIGGDGDVGAARAEFEHRYNMS